MADRKADGSSLSKAEYLKKYLSGDSGETKKRKKKKPSTFKSSVRVVDDDAEFGVSVSSAKKQKSGNVFEEHDDASDPDEMNAKPTIADYVDERPMEVQILEKFSTGGKWKTVGDDEDRKPIAMDAYKRRPSATITSEPFDSKSIKQEDDELMAGTIILPDVRKSTKMKKAEEEEAEKLRKQEERDEKYSKWSKGLAQIAQQRERAEDALKEMAKPLTRYADDEDLEKMLKDKDRIGDPMLAFKKSKKYGDEASSSNKRPQRGPPNRFGIAPGSRWDGVDRSNGFERELFLNMAERKTNKQEEQIWSVEDW